MGLLEDIGNGINSFATRVTSGADDFVADAQRNVGQLLNSGVNNQGKVTGPLAEHFGSDPVTFTLNATKHFNSFFMGTVNRVAERTGNAEFNVPASTGSGKKVKVAARAKRSDPSSKLALIVALNAAENPAVLLEEAGRQQQGLPVKRGLDGPYTWFPPMQQMSTARGFFGIDEAAAGAAALAIIVAIAPIIIGALVSVVAGLAPDVVKGVGDVLGLNPKPPPPPEGLFGIEGLDPMMAVVIGAALLIGGVLVFKRFSK